MSTGLGDILSGETPEPVAEEVEPKGETEPVETEVKETEVETKAEVTTDTPPVSEETVEQLKEQVKAFQAKAIDETRKRQEYARQVAELQQPKEVPDAFAQPDEAIKHAVSSVEQRMENKFLNMSEYQAGLRHEDFEEKKAMFFEMAEKNPALQAEAMGQPDPYEYVYQTAKNQAELEILSKAGGVDAMREKLRLELEAEMKEKFEAEKKQAMEKAIDGIIPNSLSGQRAAGGNQGATYSGPTPLTKIVAKN